MRIFRKGASADHGERAITIDGLEFDWQVGDETMQAKSSKPVSDFATHGRHRYRMKFELDEIAQLIEALAKSVGDIESAKLRDSIRPRVADLVKLTNIASNS